MTKPRYIKRDEVFGNSGIRQAEQIGLRYRWVQGEGEHAYALLRTWHLEKADPEPPSDLAVLRGDHAWVVSERPASDGTLYSLIYVIRRGSDRSAGFVPSSALTDVHPLKTLADDLTADRRHAKFEWAFDKKSCTNGAFLIQNWLRGHVNEKGGGRRGGPLRKFKKDDGRYTGYADTLRAQGNRGKAIRYHTLEGSGARVTNPNSPLTPLWPGDLLVYSRSRYWKDGELVQVPTGEDKPFWHVNLFDDDPPDPKPYTWSGHIKTVVDFTTDENGRYTEIQTLEAHQGTPRSGDEPTNRVIYTIDQLLYRGIFNWGRVPLLAGRIPKGAEKRKKYIDEMRDKADALWRDTWWAYHVKLAAKASDVALSDQHTNKANELFREECRRRGVPERDWEDAQTDLKGSGLELYGVAYWLED